LLISTILISACHSSNLSTINYKNSFTQNCRIIEIVHNENLGNSRFFDAIKYGNPYRKIELKEVC